MSREEALTPRKTPRSTPECPGTQEARQTATLKSLVHINFRVLA